ncbi:Tn3 family transposase [Variovorax paradoxus]|nr:Tn3 family transposase [Variovorax paradoxus]
MLGLTASIRAGKVSAALVIERLDSAAIGNPLHRAAEQLGRLLRTLFLRDYSGHRLFVARSTRCSIAASRSTTCSGRSTPARWRRSAAGAGPCSKPRWATRTLGQHSALRRGRHRKINPDRPVRA